MSYKNLEGEQIVVTGGAGGLGEHVVNTLTGLGAQVIATGRNQDRVAKTFADNKLVTPAQLDLSNRDSINRFAERLGQLDRLDALVLNASIWANAQQKTVDGFDMTFGVNFLGNYALLGETLDVLKGTPESKVVVVSSLLYLLGEIDAQDLHYERRRNRWEMMRYSDSKLGLIYLANYLNSQVFVDELQDHQATVAIPLQGKSGIFEHSKGMGARILGTLMNSANPSPADGAQPIIEAVANPDIPQNSVVTQPAKIEALATLWKANNPQVMGDLMAAAEAATGVSLK